MNISRLVKKAKEIASRFQNDEVVFIGYGGKKMYEDPFMFSECTDKTKLVVFEELYDLNQVEAFLNMASNPITVNKKMKSPFTIQPKFVLVCRSEITYEQLFELGSSFHKRFDIIECKGKTMTQRDVLKALRGITGKNMTEFGKVVGMPQPRISEYENEKYAITLPKFLEWCEKIGKKPEEIFEAVERNVKV